MKTAAKVLTIIGMVLGCCAIYPIVVGILVLKKLNEATTAEELRTMGIINLLFCSLAGGILMLVMKDSDLRA